MKHLILLLTLIISVNANAQLPKGSIKVTPDGKVWSTYGKTYDKVTDGQCCPLQAVCNIGNIVNGDIGNAGSIYFVENTGNPGNYTAISYNGLAVFSDFGSGGTAVLDLGTNPGTAGNGYIHLFDGTTNMTVGLDGIDGSVNMLDAVSGFYSKLHANNLTSNHNNWPPDEDGKLMVNPLKADTEVIAQTTSIAVLSYTSPTGGIYSIGGYIEATAISGGIGIKSSVSYFQSSTLHTQFMQSIDGAGNTSFPITSTGMYLLPSFNIKVDAGSTIMIVMAVGAGTTVTYNEGVQIIKIK